MAGSTTYAAAGAIGARRRWHPESTDEQLLADLEAARDLDAAEKVVARAQGRKLSPAALDALRPLFRQDST
jgi:hypothetical protein